MQGADDLPGLAGQDFGRADVFEEHDELVAADAGNGVRGPEHRTDGVGGFAQHRVAEGVSEVVVDGLEIVEIDHEQAVPGGAVLVLFDDRDDVLEHGVPVEQSGQAVAARLVDGRVLTPAAFVDVHHIGDGRERLHGFVRQRDERARDPFVATRGLLYAVFQIADRGLLAGAERKILAAEGGAEGVPVVGVDALLHEARTGVAVRLARAEAGDGVPPLILGQHPVVGEIDLNEHFAHGLERSPVLAFDRNAAVFDLFLFGIVDDHADVFRGAVRVFGEAAALHDPAGRTVRAADAVAEAELVLSFALFVQRGDGGGEVVGKDEVAPVRAVEALELLPRTAEELQQAVADVAKFKVQTAAQQAAGEVVDDHVDVRGHAHKLLAAGDDLVEEVVDPRREQGEHAGPAVAADRDVPVPEPFQNVDDVRSGPEQAGTQ